MNDYYKTVRLCLCPACYCEKMRGEKEIKEMKEYIYVLLESFEL